MSTDVCEANGSSLPLNVYRQKSMSSLQAVATKGDFDSAEWQVEAAQLPLYVTDCIIG